MKVSNKVLELLANDAALRMQVALALGISEAGMKRNIERNSSNLTKIAAIRVIKKMTGLKEKEILETAKTPA